MKLKFPYNISEIYNVFYRHGKFWGRNTKYICRKYSLTAKFFYRKSFEKNRKFIGRWNIFFVEPKI